MSIFTHIFDFVKDHYIVFLVYFILVNLFAFICYGIDKYKAVHNKWRISEAFLIITAVIGGSIGALLGMKVWRHKTKHVKFYIGVPFILILQIALVICVCILK